mgnify:FL=1
MRRGIIFDMDGTLWDSAPQVAESWNKVIEEKYPDVEVRITTEDMYRVMGKTMDVLGKILFPDLEDDKREKLLLDCYQNENQYLRAHGGKLYPDLEKVWQQLAQDYDLYIVSNCQKGYVEAFLDYFGFWHYIKDIECYGNTGKNKGENIRLVVERNQIKDPVYVGDIQGDYDASKAAGVKFIHAAYGFGTIDEAVPAIHSLDELPKVAKEIASV